MSQGFISYVAQAEVDFERGKKLTKAFNKVYERPESDIQAELLPGELTIGHAKKVIKYRANDDPTKGTSGILICTNYRVSFITTEDPTFDLIEMKNKMLRQEDITLNNIDSIFVEYPNKRKKLVPKSRVKEGIQRLELHCKDFRVVAFNFKLTIKGEEMGVIKAILHHAYPTTVSLLFALDHSHHYDSKQVCPITLYRTLPDWRDLLRRFDLGETWNVCTINKQFSVSNTMGAYFIVPLSLNGTQLSQAANQFTNDRLPIWSWTSPAGCHLIRSPELRQEVDMVEWEQKFHDAIQNTDPKRRTFKIVDVSKTCPSCAQLQQSFLKLKSMCTPGTEEEFWETDRHWLPLLSGSKWIHHVATMLSLAAEAADWITDKQHHVIVREPSGTEITPLLTCLVQILLDKTCRTLSGFQELVQREWVVGGHPFVDTLGHLVQPAKHGPNSVLSGDSEASQSVSPVFLLFLDCVYQLMRQYPCSFEINPTFLAVLYDGTRNSAFDTFFFNNERQRRRTIEASDAPREKPETLPIWAWSLQYDESQMRLFNNPLYKLQQLYLPPELLTDMTSPPRPRRKSSLDVIDEDSVDSNPGGTSFTSRSSASQLHLSNEGDSGEKSQVYYNSTTGVMVIGSRTPDSESKKPRKFSMRIKRPKGAPGGGVADSADEVSNLASSDFFHTRTLSTAKKPKTLGEKHERLRPQCGVANMRFWSSCYLRWVTWSQTFGGGPAALQEQESLLYDEVYHLLDQVTKLDAMLDTSKSNGSELSSDDSGMFFCHTPSPTERNDHHVHHHMDTPSLIPSYFPYSPIRPLSSKSMIGSPMANFLRGGSIFIFGAKNSRSTKHSRSASDLSVATPSGDESSSAAAAGGATSSGSSNSLDEEEAKQTTPKKGHHPKKALMPPKERITYISSV